MKQLFTRRRTGKAVGIVVAVGLSLTALQVPASADSGNGTNDLASRVAAGAVRADAPAAAANPAVDLPANGDDAVTIAGTNGEAALSIPATGAAKTAADGTKVFEGTADDSAVAIQTTDRGVRAAIDIKTANAPESYSFTFGGNITSLALNEDGSVTTIGANNEPTGDIAAPWAYDANGKTVPTHYEVNGKTLTQIIEHKNGDFTYGIVADPWWNPFSWPWGKWVKKSKKAVSSALKKCGKGALVTTIGLGAGTGTTNVLIEKTGNKIAKLKVGGWQGYVGAAAAGCIVNNL